MFRGWPIFALAVMLANDSAAQQQPAGGWHEPLWESENLSFISDSNAEQVADLTGDGIDDFIVGGRAGYQVIDGLTGATWFAEASSGGLVWSVADVSGDGFPDLVIADSQTLVASAVVGSVRVIEGGTAQLLWQELGDPNGARYGDQILFIDADNDGVLDILNIARYQSRTILHGSDGVQVWTYNEPTQAAAFVVADRNADGVNEIFSELIDGDVLIDGASGQEIWSTSRGFDFSGNSATVHDLDVTGDAIPDLIVAEPRARKNERGFVSVRDGGDGTLVWRRKGYERYDFLGSDLQLEDVNGDGFPELISLYRPGDDGDLEGVLHVLDARTGQRLWYREWKEQYRANLPVLRIDLDLDGLPDFVYSTFDRYTNETSIVTADSASGASLWAAIPYFRDVYVSDILTANIDHDGVDDLLVCLRSVTVQGESSLLALSGRNGQVIWSHSAPPGVDFASTAALFETLQGTAAVCSIEQSPRPSTLASLVAFDLSVGEELWRQTWNQEGAGDSRLEVVDWNQDGAPELLARPRQYYWGSFDWMRLNDLHDSGRLLWLTEGVRVASRIPEQTHFEANCDFDGDGWLDPAYRGRFSSTAPVAIVRLSGRNGSWKNGLAIDSTSFSAAQGGSAELTVAASSDQKSDYYRLLFSENGMGYVQYGGIDLPLAPGQWLTRTIAGLYPPGVFSNAIGRLDADAHAAIEVDVPAHALAGWVGRTLGFVVVTLSGQAGVPTWSTGAVKWVVMP